MSTIVNYPPPRRPLNKLKLELGKWEVIALKFAKGTLVRSDYSDEPDTMYTTVDDRKFFLPAHHARILDKLELSAGEMFTCQRFKPRWAEAGDIRFEARRLGQNGAVLPADAKPQLPFKQPQAAAQMSDALPSYDDGDPGPSELEQDLRASIEQAKPKPKAVPISANGHTNGHQRPPAATNGHTNTGGGFIAANDYSALALHLESVLKATIAAAARGEEFAKEIGYTRFGEETLRCIINTTLIDLQKGGMQR